MVQVRVIVEFVEEAALPAMRWERTLARTGDSVFELLGQAFEVAQRQDPQSFDRALTAFLKGAMVQKEDVAQVLAAME